MTSNVRIVYMAMFSISRAFPDGRSLGYQLSRRTWHPAKNTDGKLWTKIIVLPKWTKSMKRTIKKQAPIMTAFMRTSKSIGNLIPKKSASVNISRANPDHCFDILPTSSPSNVTICKQTIKIRMWYFSNLYSQLVCIWYSYLKFYIAAHAERTKWTLDA